MLGRRLRAGLDRFSGSGPQLSDASDRGLIVQPAVDKKAADHGTGATLAAPAVHVNGSAGVHFVSDTRQYPVVTPVGDDAHVGNRMREVMDPSARVLGRHSQRFLIRVEAILSGRQVDD
jgi:hypothetical protein